MDKYITGAVIRRLREKKKLTQEELANMIHVSSKAVSKWETGQGFPDISLLEPLARALDMSVIELLSGEEISNTNKVSNMTKTIFYVCPVCGNVVQSIGEVVISCCGITLPPLEAEPACPDAAHPEPAATGPACPGTAHPEPAGEEPGCPGSLSPKPEDPAPGCPGTAHPEPAATGPACPGTADRNHAIRKAVVEDEYYITMDHPMTKNHYISFIAAVSDSGVQLAKLYPEESAEARFKINRVKTIYAYCNRHGLHRLNLTAPR